MRESVEERALIKCKVSLGMFADERGVRIELPNGESLFTLADRSQLQVEREPAPGEEVDGYVWVSIIDETGGNLLIDLPQQTFTGGTRISIPKALVRSVV